MTILILGMGGEVSKGIFKSIRLSNIPCTIIGACVSLDSEGLYLCDRAYISPYASESNFIDWLIDICDKEAVNMVLTGVEENVCAISQNLSRLKLETNTIFRVSTPEKLHIGRDKYETCRWLEANGFPYPRYALPECAIDVENLIAAVGYCLIAKPRCGKGSQGIFRIDGPDSLRRVNSLSGYILEEYVGEDSQEYTVGCYRSMHGEIQTPIVMRRLLKNGSSWKTEVVQNKKIIDLAREICQVFDPDGPLNIQLRLNEKGEPIPFEFNVRFSGTTPMRAHFGFCDVKAMIYESLLKRDITSCFSIREGKAFRYAEEIYLDGCVQQEPDGRLIWK